jgi:hypothetical protein
MGMVPIPSTRTGAARNRKPSGGSWSSPRRCSTTRDSRGKQSGVRGSREIISVVDAPFRYQARVRTASPDVGGRWGLPPARDLPSGAERGYSWGSDSRPKGARQLSSSPACPTIAAVAYDEELADRIRDLIGREPDLTEKKMFDGLAFLIGGNMAVAASGQGGVMVRVDPTQSDTLVATTNARPMEMRGRPMQGWLRVDTEDLRTKRQLAKWVELGTTYARSLPAKR